MTLSFVNHVPETLNILLYGPQGSGKSAGAASAPGPILYLNADGPDALRYGRKKYGHEKFNEVVVTSGRQLDEVLLMLRNGATFGTVVMDTLSAIYTALLEEKAKGARPTLPMYGDVGKQIERFCRELRDTPVNFVVLAQPVPVKDETTGVIERTPASGTSNPALGNTVAEMMTIVGFCGRVAAADGSGARYMATLVDAPGRIGKDRTDSLGIAAELDLSKWVERANAPIAVTNEQELVAA